MGVPSFYRWLVGKYPKSVERVVDVPQDSDSNNPNPNGEFDNLYLDLNGIVHPCFHPDDEIFVPTTLDEVFLSIFDYIDNLFRIVRPRKILFLAMDGVAPRAKLNQQRARRYRTAKDAEIAEIEENKLRKEFERAGKELLPKQEYSEVSDSNVITPGTVFMQKLSKALEYYIRLRLNNDPSWKSILVILSDANVPGEGEHKIMSFIRLQRSLPGYDPITRHCLYGLDADLIMLALATHEIHFSILREDVLKKNEEINISTFVASSSQEEHDIFKTRQWYKQIETTNHRRAPKKPYQLLNIWTFREYLELDMKPDCQSVVDIERIVDDFIFICFFSGNDFLPHLPSIEIHEGGIDLLIEVYKKMFKSMGGYLVDTSRINERSTSYINFQGVKIFLSEIGSYEDKIFVKRSTLRKKRFEKLLKDQENDRIDICNSEFSSVEDNFNSGTGASAHILYSFSEKCNISSPGTVEASSSIPPDDAVENTKEFKRVLRQFIRDKSDLLKNTIVDNDRVKLGCFGWKARYYSEKFSAENAKEVEAKRIALVRKYVEGFCWVLKYYFTGVCSWSWYYSFYYGPFASDFKDLCFTEVSFTTGKPFEAFDQLMAVLPPRSSHALPKAYRSLMNNDDSPIHSFYPLDFMVDNDGKRFAWQGVCKLPFIEEPLLLEATKNLHKELQDDEVERNSVRNSKAFAMNPNSLFTQICSNPRVSGDYPRETQSHEVCGVRCGINKFQSLCEENSALSNFTSPILGMEDISDDRSRCSTFFIQEPQKHITRLLTAENIPEKTIQESDIVRKMLWHEYPGHFPPYSIQPQRYVPQTSQSPENWKGAGRGKPVIDASFPSTSHGNGRGRGNQSPMVDNWRRGIERPALGNYEYHARGRGRFSSTSSIPTSTSYDQGWGRGTRLPMVASSGRGVGAPSSNYFEYQGRGVGYQGRGGGPNYYEGQGRGRGPNYYEGEGRGGVPNYYEGQGRGRGPNYYEGQGRGRGTYYHEGQGRGGGPNYYEGQGRGGGPNYHEGQGLGGGPNYYEGEGRGGGPNYHDGQGRGRGPNYYEGQGRGGGPNYYEGQGRGGGPNYHEGQGRGGGPNYHEGQGLGRGPNYHEGQGRGGGPNYHEGQGLVRGPNYHEGQGRGGGPNYHEGQGRGGGPNYHEGQGRGGGTNFYEGQGRGGGINYHEGQGRGGGTNFYEGQGRGGGTNYYGAQGRGGRTNYDEGHGRGGVTNNGSRSW